MAMSSCCLRTFNGRLLFLRFRARRRSSRRFKFVDFPLALTVAVKKKNVIDHVFVQLKGDVLMT